MSRFASYTIEWGGKRYVIPPTRILGAIAVVEEIITLAELAQVTSKGRVQMSKLSQAYGAMLRYAGADVTDEDIYLGMFEKGDEMAKQAIVPAVNGLLLLILPPSSITLPEPDSKNESPAAAATSKHSTKQRSDKTGSRRKRSGN